MLAVTVLVAIVTSLLALTAAWATGSLSGRRLAAAAGVTLETVGALAIFMAANVTLGMTLVLGLRATTRFYPTLYEIADIALLILSLLQALLYQGWRLSRR